MKKSIIIVFGIILSGSFLFTSNSFADGGGGTGGGMPIFNQAITLSSGWNVVSTPRLVESHSFSVAETSANFDIYLLNKNSVSGWSTMQAMGQAEFTPLYGYFINNKTGQEQTLTLNYKQNVEPQDRLFERQLSSGWNIVGVANPTYALKQKDPDSSDTNNVRNILTSVTSCGITVLDFTDNQTPKSSVKVGDAWKQYTFDNANQLNDFRETKAYAVYLEGSCNYQGFQNNDPVTLWGSPDIPGTITITKKSDSPTGYLTAGATNQSLASFYVGASGEDIKINILKLQAYMAATSSATTYLKNVSLYLGGVQVGSTTNLFVTSGASDINNYTAFNIYSVIPAGATKTLEIKGDIYTCSNSACISNLAADGDKIQIKILGSTNEDNVQGMTSLMMLDAPSSTVLANELTVGTGSLSLGKKAAYGNQTVSPGSNIKIGSYDLQANAYDTANITGFTVGYHSGPTIATSKWSNMYVVYGGTTSSVKGTISTSNTFSVNTTLAANASMQIDVYATLDASAPSGSASTTLVVTATNATDGSDVTTDTVVGQNVAVATATRSVAIDTVIPSAIVVGGTQNVEMMDVRVKSLSAPSTIDQMRLKYVVAGDADVNALVSCKLNYPTDGGTAETAYLPFVYSSAATYYATFTGMTMYLPANLDKTVKVYCNYAGTGYGNTGDYPAVNLYDYRVTSGGTQTTETPSGITSQVMVLRKSKPVVAANALASTYLTAGSGITIAKFTVTPDAAGAIGWTRLVFQYASSTNIDLTTGSTYLKVYNENTGIEVTASTTADTAIDYANKDITFTASTEQVVGSATTYTLRADIDGTLGTGDYLSVYIKNGNAADTTPTTETSYAGRDADDSIVWTDRSNDSHTLATSDWTNDWLVKTIGSGTGWTMTR